MRWLGLASLEYILFENNTHTERQSGGEGQREGEIQFLVGKDAVISFTHSFNMTWDFKLSCEGPVVVLP